MSRNCSFHGRVRRLPTSCSRNRELVIEHGPFFHGGISTTECFFVKKELFDDL